MPLGCTTSSAIDPSTGFELELRYGGLDGRVLRASSNRHIPGSYRCTEDQITTSYNGSLQGVEASLTEVVKQLTAPMLGLFDFFELADSAYQRIVEAYRGWSSNVSNPAIDSTTTARGAVPGASA